MPLTHQVHPVENFSRLGMQAPSAADQGKDQSQHPPPIEILHPACRLDFCRASTAPSSIHASMAASSSGCPIGDPDQGIDKRPLFLRRARPIQTQETLSPPIIAATTNLSLRSASQGRINRWLFGLRSMAATALA